MKRAQSLKVCHSLNELELIRVPTCNAQCGWYHKWRCEALPVWVVQRDRPLFFCAEHKDEAVRERQEGEQIVQIA
jgi:hypothetical protein